MKIAGQLWLALLLVGGLMVAGCETEDGGVTDPLPSPIPPGDITVSPDENHTMAPLNAAVQAANPGNTIVVNPGEYMGTLIVDKPLRFISSAGKDNTILSNETDTTTVIVQISGSFGSADSLIFEGLGFNDGGRGVHVESSTVSIALRKCDILDNSTTGIQIGDGTGGAAGNPSLDLWQCFFRRNGAGASTLTEGAALWTTASLVANSIFFDANMVDIALTSAATASVERMTATATDSVCLYLVEGSTMTLDGISSEIPTILRDGNGWGARVTDSTLNILNFTVQRFGSGGIQLVNSSLSVDNTLLTDLERFAIWALDSQVTVRNSQLIDTDPAVFTDEDDVVHFEFGYAIWAETTNGQSHTLLVDGSVISGSFRSGIQATGSGQLVDLRSSELTENGVGWVAREFENDPAEPVGGGLGLFDQASASLTETTFSLNFGVCGGGIALVGAGASLNIDGGEFRGNSSTELGAGILIEGSTASIANCRFLSNNSKGYGGGLAVVEGGQITLDNTPLLSNISSRGGGGAYVFRGTATFANESSFINNASVKSSLNEPDGTGGALFLDQAEVSLDGTTFEGNQADLGGALYVTSMDRDAVIRNCIFFGNKSAVSAAVLYARDLTRVLLLESCQIYDNELTVPDTTVPSAIYSRQDLPGGRLNLQGCTVTDNRNGGGVIWHQSGEMSITETVVAYNTPAGLVGNDLQFVEMGCNDFWNNGELDYGPGADPGAGSISEDPLFCDRANNVYTVDSTSPLLPANNSCGVRIGARGQGCAAKM